MNLPFHKYYSVNEFDNNYKKDLAEFKSLIPESTELHFLEYLQNKYLDLKIFLDTVSMESINLVDSKGSHKYLLCELFAFPNVKEVMTFYKEEANNLKYFRSKKDFEFLISTYFSEEDGNLIFDDVAFKNLKFGIENISLRLFELIKNYNKTKSGMKDYPPLDFDLNQQEVIWLFDILQEAGFIKEPKFHDGSYYRKIETFFTANGKEIKHPEQKRNKYLENGISTSDALIERLKTALEKF